MTAPFSEELISAYLDGELTPAEQVHVEQLLVESTAAERMLKDFQALRGLLRGLPQEPPAANLVDSIRTQIEQTNSPNPEPAVSVRPAGHQKLRRKQRLPLAFLSSAVGVLLLLGGLWLFRPAGERAAPDTFLAQREGQRLSEPESLMMEGSQRAADASPDAALGLFSQSDATEMALSRMNKDELAERAPIAGSAPLAASTTDNSEMIAAGGEIPPLPQLTASQLDSLLRQLVNSPKLQGKLQPGELVQLMSVDDEQVTVVELSVVDVIQSLGDVQVLLASQQINSPQTQNLRFRDGVLEKTIAGSPSSRSQEQPDQTPPAEPVVAPQQPEAEGDAHPRTKPGEHPPHDSRQGLIALYVETTDTQFLAALQQMEALAAVQHLRIGESAQLKEPLYSVTPMEEDATWSLRSLRMPTEHSSRDASRGQQPFSAEKSVPPDSETRAETEAENRLTFQLVQLPPEAGEATAMRRRLQEEVTESPRYYVNRKQVAESAPMTLAAPAPADELQNGVAAAKPSQADDLADKTEPQKLQSLADRNAAEVTSEHSRQRGQLSLAAAEAESYQIPVLLRPQTEPPTPAEAELVENHRALAKRDLQAEPELKSPTLPTAPARADQQSPTPLMQTPEASALAKPTESDKDTPLPPLQRVRALIILSSPTRPAS